MKVYFDHAATTPLIEPVKNEMFKVMDEVYGNPSSIHHSGRQARTIIESARKTIARAFKASIGEIYFTSGATEANNMILTQAVETLGKTVVIYSPIEHHCVLHTIQHLEKSKNIEAIPLRVDPTGTIDMNHAESLIKKHQKNALLSVMYANNEIGVIQDIPSLGLLCKQHEVLFHSDLVQAVGKFPLDFTALGIDFACGSAHKFFGPKGAGFVYISNNVKINPFIHGGGQERNMRAGTENLYGIAGMAKALEVALDEMEHRHNYVQDLRNHFKTRLLSELDDIQINGTDDGLYNILNVSFPPSEKSLLLMFNLDIHGICASSGSACSSGTEKDSHVMEAIGHSKDRKAIRFSLSHLNTREEIDYAVDKLKSMTPATVA